MKWIYYIPHVWDTPADRKIWEDVYLMPDIDVENKEDRESVWLTVDALGKEPTADDFYTQEEFADALAKLGDLDYVIDNKQCDMLVRAEDFNMEELLSYSKIFIKEIIRDEDIVLTEGSFEKFAGTNTHANIVEELGDL